MPSVPRAVTENLQPLGIAGLSTQLWLALPGQKAEKAPTSVSLSDQGLVQVLEASVTGLEPGKPYVLALANELSGAGVLQPLQGFMTNPAGAAIVNAIGPIRQIVRGENKSQRRYLVVAPGTADNLGAPVQVQMDRCHDSGGEPPDERWALRIDRYWSGRTRQAPPGFRTTMRAGTRAGTGSAMSVRMGIEI
jgi:hypothetical protein